MNAPGKPNPKRWYLVVVFCIILSYIVFMIGPKLGYDPVAIRTAAILIGMWAPTAAIFGVRAELLQKKE